MKKLFLFLTILVISGCVTQQDFYSLQREVAVLKSQFRENAALFSAEAGEIKSSTKRLDELHGSLRKSFADTNARMEELEQSINKIRGKQEDLERQSGAVRESISEAFKLQNDSIKNMRLEMKRLTDDLVTLKTAHSVTFSNVSALYTVLKANMAAKNDKQVSEGEKKALYDNALELYKKGDYNNAIEKFSFFANLYPYDTLAPNALYWIGECYYAQKKFDTALPYFHRVVTDFPNSGKVPSALLKEAFTLKELGMDKESQAAIEELLYRFPYSEESKEAKKFKEKKK